MSTTRQYTRTIIVFYCTCDKTENVKLANFVDDTILVLAVGNTIEGKTSHSKYVDQQEYEDKWRNKSVQVNITNKILKTQ